MRNKKFLFLTVLIILIAGGVYVTRAKEKKPSDEVVKEISPSLGRITTFISSTGTILPKNRLEIKPPVNGRIEEILVKEGDMVRTGDILAWMSSTERAALIDAARAKGEDVLKYWEDAYKPIPLLAPIDGEVIVEKIQPGQTITTSDAVAVLSDRLIVRGQVDEIDIGKIKVGKRAIISIDAYPDEKVDATVQHIYYESKTVNNVTVYEADLLPEEVPGFFRSGMNATIDFVDQDKENILIIPVDAAQKEKEDFYVLIRQGGGEPLRSRVTLGISDDKNIEVISGVRENDRLIIRSKKYSVPTASETGKNPFMPSRRR
ncbi:MAG: HlyD family efflux transporter periplasmic adaptor subunit [Candidatus Omnitrophota bacterium]